MKRNWITYCQRRSSITFKKEYKFKNIKKVVINITAIGWYNLFVNGDRIDKDVFSPGYTDYCRRVQYQSYDITKHIKSKCSLRIDTAEGWGGGDHFAWAEGKYFTYYQISINYEIVVTYLDGRKEVFVSDESVDTYSNDIVESTIYNGETRDFRLKEEYLGKAKRIDIKTKIIPQEGPEIVFGERISAKEMFRDTKGNLLIDFGQNFAGMVEVHIKGKKGDKISYTPGEILDKDGVFYNENYRTAKSFYSFILTGEEEIILPRFSFLGGRYIKLIDYPDYIQKENFTAVLVHSKMNKTCTFECGNPKIQRLYLNTLYGQLSNYLDIPSDCPQRDERLGWTADTQVFCHTAAIHFDIHQFLKKWVHELIIDQYTDGGINGVIPLVCQEEGDYEKGMTSTGWGEACTIVPWELYLTYGDKKLLKESLPMMKKWVSFLESHFKKPYIIELDFYWGDWCALDKIQDGICAGLTSFSLLSTAYYVYDLEIIINASKVLGLPYQEYEEKIAKAKEAYQKEFIKDGHMNGPKGLMFSKMERTPYTQTGLVFTLYFNMCKEEDRSSLINDLVNLIHECGDTLSTGFLGTPYLLQTLADNGHPDVAYTLLFQEKYPSWLYSVNLGATTMWEHYDGIREDGSIFYATMNSFNHYAYGAVFSYVFNYSVGIKNTGLCYKEITIEPIVDKRLGYVDCTYKSKYGDIKVYWKYNDDKVDYRISVPKGIKATIKLENKEPLVFDNGGELNI